MKYLIIILAESLAVNIMEEVGMIVPLLASTSLISIASRHCSMWSDETAIVCLD
jgi:hypothetical protein